MLEFLGQTSQQVIDGLVAAQWVNAGCDDPRAWLLAVDPAMWSAVAAICATVTTLLMMLTQRRALLESVRPELVLSGWNRRVQGVGDSRRDVIAFESIRNIGRGVAINVTVHALKENAKGLVATALDFRVPVLGVNEEDATRREIVVWWKNVPEDSSGERWLFFDIDIVNWDFRNVRHFTRYTLAVRDPEAYAAIEGNVVPGVAIVGRTTTSRPVWLLGLVSRLWRLLRRAGLVRRRWACVPGPNIVGLGALKRGRS